MTRNRKIYTIHLHQNQERYNTPDLKLILRSYCAILSHNISKPKESQASSRTTTLRGILFIFDVYFLRCLIKLRHLAETEQMTSKEHIVVHFARVHFSVPRLKWDRVEQMINKELVEHGVDVIVYSRDKNDAHRISQNK